MNALGSPLNNGGKYGFTSRHINKVEIDFEGLPNYIIQKGIAWQFEEVNLINDDDYINWKNGLLQFYSTIPNEYILKTLVKGIEYGKKAYQRHKTAECTSPNRCQWHESWDRRIAIAEQLLNDLCKANNITPDGEPIEPAAENENSKEFTTARQVLAIHYLLEYCQIKNVDNTAKARFVQFLTGKETGAKDIKNTTIYKRVAKPLGNDNKTLMADLAFVRGHFESLGLFEISKMITNEMSKG